MNAKHPTVYAELDVPAETERIVVAEGEGWVAVVPSDRVITNTGERRGGAEYHGHEILGPVRIPLADGADYDLVRSMPTHADPQRRGADE